MEEKDKEGLLTWFQEEEQEEEKFRMKSELNSPSSVPLLGHRGSRPLIEGH